MWKKIKSLLFPKQKVSTQKVALSELISWFDVQTEPKLRSLALAQKEANEKILSEIEQTFPQIERLKHAQLMNAKIPEREKHIMEGNRESYVRRVTSFLKQLKPVENLDDADDDFLRYTNDVQEFTKSVHRSYAILQHFFANETRDISRSLKNIDRHFLSLKDTLSQSNLSTIHGIKKQIRELHTSVQLKKDLQEELHHIYGVQKRLSVEKDTIQKERDALMDGAEFREMSSFGREIESLNQKLKMQRAILESSFAVIEVGLRKYVRIAPKDQERIDSYLENPLEALRGDISFTILETLQGFKSALEKKALYLKEKKEERMLVELGKLDRFFLSGFVISYAQLQKEQDAILKKMDSLTIRNQVKEVKARLAAKEEEIKQNNLQVDEMRETLRKINISLMKENIIEDIAYVLNIKLELDEHSE